jgi:hypothetical protein
MCWNSQVSLNTFLFSTFVLLLVMYNNYYTQYKIKGMENIWVYVFFMSFITMQLIEFFIWRNLDNKYYNNLFSTIAMLLLFIQPICSLMMMSDKKIRNKLILIYMVISILYITTIWKNILNNSSVKNKNGHLEWKFGNFSSIYLIFWFLLFFTSFVYEKNCSGLIFGISILLISIYNYSKNNTFESMWCWSVNSCMLYYAFILLIYLPYIEHKNLC